LLSLGRIFTAGYFFGLLMLAGRIKLDDLFPNGVHRSNRAKLNISAVETPSHCLTILVARVIYQLVYRLNFYGQVNGLLFGISQVFHGGPQRRAHFFGQPHSLSASPLVRRFTATFEKSLFTAFRSTKAPKGGNLRRGCPV
jgi:hypothetical protein